MTWDAVGAIAELLGALGVILTLLYLSKQIENNSKLTLSKINLRIILNY